MLLVCAALPSTKGVDGSLSY